MKKVEIISNANVHAEEERKMKVEELISLLKNGGSVIVDTAVANGTLTTGTNKSKQVPKINVCAPDTVGDLINQMRGEGAQQQDDQAHAGETVANDANNQPEKKSVIPKAVVSADSELDRIRELLSSGNEIEINPDGTLVAAGTNDKSSAAKEKSSSASTKAKTIPKAVVSADTVGDLINQMRGEGGQQQDDQTHADEAVANDASNQPEKKSVIPKAVVSADTVGDLINQMRGEGAQQQGDQAHAGETVANDASNQPEKKSVIPKAVVSASQWYETNKDLYNAEVAAMRKEFNNPNLEPKFMSDGRMYWVVNTTPNLGPGFKTMNYKLLLVYDPDHPKVRYGSSVKVYPVKPTIDELQSIVNRLPGVSPKNIPHTLVDGTGARYLCTADTTNVSADLSKGITSAVTSYRFAYRWLMIFELGIRDPKTWAKFHRHGEI